MKTNTPERTILIEHFKKYHYGYPDMFLQNHPIGELCHIHSSEHEIIDADILVHSHANGSLLYVVDEEDVAFEDS